MSLYERPLDERGEVLREFFRCAWFGPLAEKEAAFDLAETYGHWDEFARFQLVVFLTERSPK